MESTLMATGLQPVVPVRPVAPYIGGKRNLAGRLVRLIEDVPHEIYAEPFVGMGGVFLRRRARPRTEIINDWSGEVANFYRVLQVHYVHLVEVLRFQITSRAEFDRLCRVDPSTLTDIYRAARFLYLQRTAFGGKVTGQNFGMSLSGRGGRFDVTKLGPMLEDLHERLAGVVIERLPWSDFITRYDRPAALFYLDPPYAGCEDDYGKGMFAPAEFELMAAQLAGLKGRFILSINDTPRIREIFAGFHLASADVTYSVSGAPTGAKELIISN